MIRTLDIIDRLPLELAARLESDEFFADIPVIVAEEGDLAAELARKVAVITEKGGKRGAAVIVLQVVCEDDYPNLQFGPLTLYPSFQVVENVELNRDGQGTGKSARRIARRIRDVIKCYGSIGMIKDLRADKPCIQPVQLGPELGELVRAYQVSFRCLEVSPEVMSQVATPQFAAAPPESFGITCATEGATIYYTTDDSFPGPANALAGIYFEPQAIPPEGITVRAAAYKAGSVGSWSNRATITVS